MQTHRFTLSLRPGDRIAEDEEIHNGNGLVVKTSVTHDLTGCITLALWFADGSITEQVYSPTDIAPVVRLES